MAAIGGVACTFVKGDLPNLTERADVWQIAGLNGYGIQRMGTGNGQFRIVAVLYSTTLAVEAWYVALAALGGQIVTIINDWGTTAGNCFIERVSPLERTNAGVTGAARGQVVIEGIRTQ